MEKIALTIPGFGNIDSPTGLPSGVPTGGLSDGTGQNILITAVELFVIGAILLSLYYIIRGGINMSTSGGHKEKFQLGRERVRYAIIGLVIIFMSMLIVNFIGNFFGVPLIGNLNNRNQNQNQNSVNDCGYAGKRCCPGNACHVGNCAITDQICKIP